MSSSTTKHRVASLSQLKDKEEVKIGDNPVLLAKHKGQVYAVGAKCTHYGAPLKNGVLTSDGRITCPWHGACFNVTTGDIEDAPALDALAKYKVEVSGDDVFVVASEEELKQTKRFPSCQQAKAADTKDSVLIVGGGAGGLQCAESLRESGYTGAITILTKEPNLPLDRTKLSKALIGDASKLEWRSKDDLAKLDVKVQHATVNSVDKKKKTIKLESGDELAYSKLVLATGAYPSKLPIDGVNLGNIFLMRIITHAQEINKAVGDDKSKHVVLVGGSFIGLELATALIGKAASVTIVEPAYPLKPVLGEKVAQRLVKLHEEKGVKFIIGKGSVKKFRPSQKDSGVVGSVELENGQTLQADAVILATGVKPQTEFLKEQFEIQKDGGLDVEQNLLVKGEDSIYAIGDIARFKHPGTETYGRIEHWNVAQNHGRAAGAHIAGKGDQLTKVPIFWSAQQGKQLRYCGHSTDYDDVIVDGNLDELTFTSFYVKGDKVEAVATIGTDPMMSHCSELMRLGKMLSASDIRSGKSPLDVSL